MKATPILLHALACPAFAFSPSAASCRSAEFQSRQSLLQPLKVSSTEDDTTTSASPAVSSTSSSHESSSSWATHAILFSSLTDGIIPNEAASRSFLRYSLAKTILREHISCKEDKLESSVKFSPCNGPNVDALNNLESVDELYARGLGYSIDDTNINEQWADEALQCVLSGAKTDVVNIRVLYIPTAMYALNPQSTNTPGKQRQRARADGKKRRTQLLKLIDELLSLDDSSSGANFNILSTTLDLDDGSLKQPVGSDDTTLFPENDKAALTTWQPHLIYVEGGNTFWLQHCIEKGDYSTIIKDACTGPNGSIYCGKSAGAIVAGKHVATATWKGWDDPSVVPDKPKYEDWLDCIGFQFVGDKSFFPHMSDDWNDTVEVKRGEQQLGDNVCCLREEDAYCVIGRKKLSFLTSWPTPTS